MVYVAFSEMLVDISGISSEVESASVFDDRLLVGGRNGSLFVFSLHAIGSKSLLPPGISRVYSSVILSESKPSFHQGPITQIEVFQSKGIILILSDLLYIHSFVNLDKLIAIRRVRGANTFCLNQGTNLLCIAVKKKLFFYNLPDLKNCLEVKEISVPDAVRSLAWSDNSVAVGFSSIKEYWLVDTETWTTTDISTSGRSAPPLVATLTNGDIIVGKDYMSLFLDKSTKSTGNSNTINWSESPLSISVYSRYILARLSNSIEVRSMNYGHPLVQTIPLKGIRFLTGGNSGLVAATEKELHLLLPRPITEQVQDLAMAAEFESALFLCGEELPAQKNNIRIRYGYHLFSEGLFEESMEQFWLANHSVPAVISLFPGIELPEGDYNELAQAGEDGEAPVYGNGDSWQQEIDKIDLSSGELMQALISLVGFLVKKREGILKAAFEDLQQQRSPNEELTPGFGQRIHGSENQLRSIFVATVLDTVLLQAILQLDSLGSDVGSLEASVPYEKTSVFRSFVDSLQSESGPEFESNSVLIWFLASPNYCSLEVCEKLLLQKEKFMEVVLLYGSHGLHRKALELMRELGSNCDREGENWMQKVTFSYLKNLGAKQESMVLEFSEWLLEKSPEIGLKLFIEMEPPMQSDIVLNQLRKCAPSMRALFLEHRLSSESSSADSHDLHNELIRLHIDRVLDERARQIAASEPWKESYFSDARAKLMALIQKSTAYNPATVLCQLPSDAFHSERALLFEKLNNHHAVLVILARKLKSPQKCLAYCDIVYNSLIPSDRNRIVDPDSNLSARKNASSVYSSLLEVYLYPVSVIKEFRNTMVALLEPSKQEIIRGEAVHGWGFDQRVMREEAIAALVSEWRRFDPQSALLLFASDTQLVDLIQYINPLLMDCNQQERSLSLLKSVRILENLSVKEELICQKKRAVIVTSETVCHSCQKRIGGSVFGVYPDNSIVHFGCQRN